MYAPKIVSWASEKGRRVRRKRLDGAMVNDGAIEAIDRLLRAGRQSALKMFLWKE